MEICSLHFTNIKDSFFGQIESKVSWSIDHCDRTALRMDRWIDDFTLVCPETSVEGENFLNIFADPDPSSAAT